jgi:hypothetical protein
VVVDEGPEPRLTDKLTVPVALMDGLTIELLFIAVVGYGVAKLLLDEGVGVGVGVGVAIASCG